ncbi:unnamed protein product [Caenorhabditis sp. 36 PRJEB53466]|nr:unnamed protein product [Caenorhabditis sp. 36 PRJEB53466]
MYTSRGGSRGGGRGGRGGNGGGGPPRRGGRGGAFGGDRNRNSRSPDRTSERSQETYNRFREGQRPMSRSPTPDRNNGGGPPQNPFGGRPISRDDRIGGGSRRDSRDRSFRAPHRYDDKSQRLENTFQRAERADSPVSEKEKFRVWKLKIADAEETVRRAEFELRRAKLDYDSILESYEEFTKATAPTFGKPSAW